MVQFIDIWWEEWTISLQTYYVSVLSQFMEKPVESHWNATIGILMYLKIIIDYGVKYTNSFYFELTSYSYSNWVGNQVDQRYIIGYDFGIWSGIVSCINKKKPIVYFSSIEAKYKALCATTCEVVWLRRLIQYVGEE